MICRVEHRPVLRPVGLMCRLCLAPAQVSFMGLLNEKVQRIELCHEHHLEYRRCVEAIRRRKSRD